MIHQKIPQEIKTYCGRLISEYNFGHRGIADGNREEQYTGMVGQCMICKLFETALPTGEGGFDQGVDLTFEGLSIDVKTMGRTTAVRPHYVNNFIGLQKDYKTDIYIFCSINKKTSILTVCGWVTKAQLLERASFFKKGTKRYRSDGSWFRTKADLYEIANSKLNPADSVKELKENLVKYRIKFH